MPEAVNDIRNWRIFDPAPTEPLDTIHPFSQRALALVARNSNKTVLQTNFLQIAGAVSILKGLDYHRDRFVHTISELASGVTLNQGPLLHEAVAYVNRAGQYYYFTQSALVKRRGSPAVPKIEALLMFRHKHTAHRSIDMPSNEDSEQLQTVHAMALSELGGRLFHPKDKPIVEITDVLWGRAYLGFQIHKSADQIVDLVIERDHDSLMQEAYGVFESVLR